MSDLFDLNDFNGLPDSMRKRLKSSKRDDSEIKIIELFKIARRPLTIDEVWVGFFRKYNIEKPRKYIMMKLYNMARADDASIERLKDKKGVYKLKQDLFSA